MPCPDNRSTTSSRVRSGSAAIRPSSTALYSSSGERLPPLGKAATLPVACQRCILLIAELELTAKRPAAARRDWPPSTASTIRSRRSFDKGFAIPTGLHSSQSFESQTTSLGNPPADSVSGEFALERFPI